MRDITDSLEEADDEFEDSVIISQSLPPYMNQKFLSALDKRGLTNENVTAPNDERHTLKRIYRKVQDYLIKADANLEQTYL